MATFRDFDPDGDPEFLSRAIDRDPYPTAEAYAIACHQRDEWWRQNGLLRGELNAARTKLAELAGPSWRYRAFGPNDEIVLDPGIGERWTMAELGGWRLERQPVYSGKWEPTDLPARDDHV